MTSLFLLSLPSSAVPGTMGEPETRLKNWLEQHVGAAHGVASIALPDLKTGMLDNLVQQADDVAKLDSQLQTMVLKCDEMIFSIFKGDKAQIAAAEQVDGRPAGAYLQQFGWNTAKYRPDRPISALLAALSQEAAGADQDLKARIASYESTKQQVAALDRKFSGDLSVRSLDAVVRPADLVQSSDFLQTLLIAVPAAQQDDFLAKYETLAPMVVPRSANKISADEKYALYGVTVFRKFAREFESKAREQRWAPRDAPTTTSSTTRSTPNGTPNGTSTNYSNTTNNNNEAELRSKERRQRTEVERLAAVTFSDLVKAWGHIKVIRVFVESVLRYGLPTSYVTASFVPTIGVEKAEARLVSEFAFLGGNAVSRDSRGRPVASEDLAEYAALVEQDYRPFVIYIAKLPSPS